MIVVTGANGRLGRAVVERLLDRVPADQIVASVRDSARAETLAGRGVQLRDGDFSHPDTLPEAFKNAAQVLIVSVDRFGEDARRMHETAIRAARAAGARRVLYTSHIGARPNSAFADHAAAEAVLAATGTPFTTLRHGFYAESALHLIGRGLETGEIRAPEDGPVSWTARDDLAEADAVLLAEDGRLEGVTPPLVANEALTMSDIATIASEITGRTIRHIVVPDEAWHAETVANGVPAPLADALLGMYQAARRGELASADQTLRTLLGRSPRRLRDVLETHLSQGAAAAHG